VDTTQVVIAVIGGFTTIALAYIAARWHVTREDQKTKPGGGDTKNTPQDRKPTK
jgi:hypothetical protein